MPRIELGAFLLFVFIVVKEGGVNRVVGLPTGFLWGMDNGGVSAIRIVTVARVLDVYHGLDPWTFEALTWVNQHADGI
jgi:hypothetical protein